MSFLGKLFGKKEQETLDQGLEKTKQGFFERISKAIVGKTSVDDEVLDQLEEALIGADVGVDTTLALIERIQERVKKDKYVSTTELNQILYDEIANLLVDAPQDLTGFQVPADKKPFITLVVGVNGVGKTTTIGKLAHHFKAAGNEVLLGAADTFRAAAVDQLTIWSERVGVPIVKQNMGADPSSVAFDTVQSALARKSDIVFIDTAGRLHNKAHLMDELNKINRVIQKQIPDAPHEVLLVLDGSTGQNALEQAKQFMAVTNVTALAITKLDGTAKGGVLLAIAHQCKIPVKYIGVGEQLDDLILFDKVAFVKTLFKGVANA
ncbi:MAG: signal recognition particle-docking protein FtsY [Sediminibacterium sp.]|nr:signal recognition particle-docking protein FtsY [Sediminibacterium sp.]MBP6144066.1 signal recognition particle-docking protein FtsY [Sediminibacterium sp.]